MSNDQQGPKPDAAAPVRPADMGVVIYRLGTMEQAVRELTAQVGKLVLIEERQSRQAEAQERAFKTLGEHDRRLKALELAQPITQRTNTWVERGALALVAMAAGAALAGKFF